MILAHNLLLSIDSSGIILFFGWHSVQLDVCDPALHIIIMGLFLMFPVLWKTIFWNNYA